MTIVGILAGTSLVFGVVGVVAELRTPDEEHHRAILIASTFGILVGVWFGTLAIIA